ncbi:hypothetical protein NH8B_3179 [Pseudogulbenkiania sp. NH8B]|nr:hypothetical protein NH8B_3179 [Pseudogulbenkiania sp. NH8B]
MFMARRPWNVWPGFRDGASRTVRGDGKHAIAGLGREARTDANTRQGLIGLESDCLWGRSGLESRLHARVVKLVDTRDLKSLAARCTGSTPVPGTILN